MAYDDHTYSGIAVGLTLGIGVLVAIFVLFHTPPVTAASFDNVFSTFGMPNPFHPYKINTTCELAYFLVNGPPSSDNLLQKISTEENFKKNFPDEYYRLTSLVSTNQYMQFLSSGNIMESQSVKDLSGQLKDIIIDIAMKEYSINPEHKNAILTLMSTEVNSTALNDAIQTGGCESEMEQKYANWNTQP